MELLAKPGLKLAVLPMRDSPVNEAEDDYFHLGFIEDRISDLPRFPNLGIILTTSSFSIPLPSLSDERKNDVPMVFTLGGKKDPIECPASCVAMKTRRFNNGEVEVNFAEQGIPTKPPLFLHGLTARWKEYAPIIQDLSKTGHTYTYHLRGYGASGRATGGYGLPDHSRDALKSIENVIQEPTTIAGHSLGAAVAIH